MPAAPQRKITLLTKQAAVEQAIVADLVKQAQANVAEQIRDLAQRANNPTLKAHERQKLYDQIAKINLAMGADLDAWAAEMVGRVAPAWHQQALGDVKADKKSKVLPSDVLSFDRARAEQYLRIIHPDNSSQLAAVFTQNLTKSQVGNLRQAVVDVYRQSALTNMTANELQKAIQNRWNEVAGSIEFDRFVDRAGRRRDNATYLSMLVRTTTARVARDSYIDTLVSAGDDLAQVQSVGDNCPVCRAWSGVIVSMSGKNPKFPSYQQALSAGMYHPNCDCLLRRMDALLDGDEIAKQEATGTPPGLTDPKVVADYSKDFVPNVSEARQQASKAEADAVAKAAAEAATKAQIAAAREQNRALASKTAFASAGKAAEQAYEDAKKAEAAAEARRLALADSGIRGAREFGSTLKRSADKVGGSTGAYVVEDDTGQKWVFKHYAGNAAQAQNEYIANQLYAKAGVLVPSTRLAEHDGKLGIASKMIDGVSPIGAKGVDSASKSAAVKSGFVADAWLANWDVAGASFDNVLQIPGSKTALYRVDQGGSLLYRAQGSPKGVHFGKDVKELSTLRDAAMNAQSAKLFANVTDADVAKQIRGLKRAMKMADVDEIIAKSGMDPVQAASLRKTVTARLTYLKKWERDWTAAQKMAAMPRPAGVPAGVDLVDKIDDLDPAAKRAWAKMQQDYKDAVTKYTGSSYASINTSAARGKALPGLDAALGSALPRYAGFVGRGHGDLSIHAADWEKWKSGEYAFWSNKGYTSTAVVPEKVWSKPFKIIFRQKGLQAGGYVDPVSSNKGEKEYLLGRGNKYRVVGWGENKTGTQRFLLVEEPDDPNAVPDRQQAPMRLDYDAVIKEWRDSLK